MNYISNSKTAKICKDIAEIDRTIQEKIFSLEDEEIRKLVDERRHLSSLLILMQEPNDEQSQSTQWYNTDPTVERLLDDWVEKVKTDGSTSLDFTDNKFCDDFVDLALPKTWHFENDVIVIVDPPSLTIIENIIKRGQRHVVVFADLTKSSKLGQKLKKAEHVQFCTDLGSVERLFATLQAAAGQVIIIPCQTEANGQNISKEDITKAINAGKKTRFENTRTVSKFGQSWSANLIRNLPALAESRNLHEMRISGVKDAVVVAAGPSLDKNVDKLRKIQRNVFIVAALRSLPVLQAAGVEPDLVVQLDAESDAVADSLLLEPNYKIKNFLFEPTISPGFLKLNREQTIWSLGQHFFDVHEFFASRPTPFNVPSVSIYCLCLCHYLKFQNICIIGQDLAASDGQQYAEKATKLIPAQSNLSMFNIEVPGFYGEKVLTRNSFNYQIKRCSEIAAEWKDENPEINLVNATEGGAYIDGFDHMSLDDFLVQRELDQERYEKKIYFTEGPLCSHQKVNEFLAKTKITFRKIIDVAGKIIQMDEKHEQTRGLRKKINKTVKKFQLLNDSTSFVQIALQNDISKVIGTSNSQQEIDTHSEFFKKIQTATHQLLRACDE